MRTLFISILILFFSTSLSAQTKPRAAQPLFRTIDMNGRTVNSDDLNGKIAVLNLWFVNCPNCVEEIKLLNGLVDQYKDNKDVVFIAFAASSKTELEKFLFKHLFNYQVIPNAASIILAKFGTPNKNGEVSIPFPMHYVLDRNGKVIVEVQGVKGIEAVKAELTKQFAPKTTVLR